MNRRTLLKGAIGGALTPFFAVSGQSPASDLNTGAQVRIMIPPDYVPPVYGDKGRDYVYRLGRATLDCMHKHYSGRKMPIWDKRPDEVDLEKRIINIAYWVGQGVAESRDTYPMDPAWIMAQIMAESLFYEFAISWAFAVGVCQFISPTASEYGLVCADETDLPRSALKLPHLAGELEHYYALIKRVRRLQSKHEIFTNKEKILEESLRALSRGEDPSWASEHLHLLGEEKKLDKEIKNASKNYARFLEVNFQGRSIFNTEDLEFLRRFDQRVTYAAPIRAMTRMMAKHLRARQGNVLTATAGYNAGLSNTSVDSRIYGPYGIIPSFEQTVTYVSRIAVNHHEIASRI